MHFCTLYCRLVNRTLCSSCPQIQYMEIYMTLSSPVFCCYYVVGYHTLICSLNACFFCWSLVVGILYFHLESNVSDCLRCTSAIFSWLFLDPYRRLGLYCFWNVPARPVCCRWPEGEMWSLPASVICGEIWAVRTLDCSRCAF